MDINRNAPAIAERDIRIVADTTTVWEVISDLEAWPAWNDDIKSVQLRGSLGVGSVFQWKSGAASLTSTLGVVDPPNEIGWTGKTMGIRAVHVFRFESRDGKTVARSEESWEGLIASLLKGYSRRTLERGLESFLGALKREAESRTDK